METRVDYNFKKVYEDIATKEREGLTDWRDVMIIVEEFPEINTVLAYRGGEFEPWCVGYDYNGKDSWWHGNYFPTLDKAMRYIQSKIDIVPFYRLEELASKAIDGLIEDDPYEAAEYFKNEMEMTEEEIEYFGVVETMDMVKGYEED